MAAAGGGGSNLGGECRGGGAWSGGVSLSQSGEGRGCLLSLGRGEVLE